MFDIVIEDFRSYRRPFLSQGYWALLVHRFGYFSRSTNIPVLTIVLKLLHIILTKLCEILFGIYIGAHVKIGRRFVIEHFGCIIIHSHTIIGDDVIVRQGVTIGNKVLDRPLDAPVVGNRVNIGAGAKLLGNIVIGNDVDIGANAVVLVDVPDKSMAVGVPARIVDKSHRFAASI
ncbi:MAG: serine acetyltransferase [Azonexus sp.]